VRTWRTDAVRGLAVVVTDMLAVRFDHDFKEKSTEVFVKHARHAVIISRMDRCNLRECQVTSTTLRDGGGGARIERLSLLPIGSRRAYDCRVAPFKCHCHWKEISRSFFSFTCSLA
jgi:hypothetical protein